MALRWLLPVLVLGGGITAAFMASARGQHSLSEAISCLMLVAAMLLFGSLKWLYPQAGITVVGTLTIQADELLVQWENQPLRCFSLLQNAPHVVIQYEGYQDERVGRITLDGTENFISLNSGPQLRFWVPDESLTLDLQTILRSWYLRKIPVKEYCLGSRTFLLTRELSYEQIQAYKQEFGVSLYN